MTKPVFVTESAAADIEEDVRWWARERSLDQALRWYAEIREVLQTLGGRAERYPRIHEGVFPLRDLREQLFGTGRHPTHRIVFEIQANAIYVIRVRHVAQDESGPEDFPPLNK